MPFQGSNCRRRNQPALSTPPRTTKRAIMPAPPKATAATTSHHQLMASARGDLLRRIFLARVDARLQDVLLRRQRASRELAERARRVVGAIEIEREGLAGRRLLLDEEETARAVRRLARGVVLHDQEE